MLASTKEFLEATTLPLMLAMFGGLARVCRFGVTSWRQFGGSIMVSAFTGVVVHLLIQETALSNSVQAAIVATSGYSGGAILDAAQARIVKAVHHLPGPGAEDEDQLLGDGKDHDPDQHSQDRGHP